MNSTKKIGLLLAVGVFVIQSLLVPFVGMSWDEPSSFFVGRANLKFWLSGDRRYLNELRNRELFKDSPIQYIYGEDIYPPFPFVVASAFSYVFAEKLNLIPVFDAHHIGEIAIASLGVWAMFGIGIEAGLMVPTAIIVALVYALYPSIWGPMRNDAKDIPLVSMIVVCMYFFMKWIRTKKEVWGLFFAVSLGLAGASKPTAVIILPIIFIWLLTARRKLLLNRRFLVFCVLLGVLSLAVFLFSWPWLWENPVKKLTEVFTFFKSVGYNMPTPYFGTIYHAAVNLPRDYAYTILLLQTPPELLVLALIGLLRGIVLFFMHKKPQQWLFVVWFLFTMGRFLIPGVIIYAWVRHFIDAMPAFFLLAGFGLEYAAGIIGTFVRSLKTAYTEKLHAAAFVIIIGSVLLLHEALISFRLFPYETSYFNAIVGGTKGVADHWLFDVGQGAGVKEAMEFIAADSKGKEVYVYPCLLGHIARFYAPANVKLTTSPELGNYTFAPNSPSWFEGALTFGTHQHKIAHTISRGGADLFYVFKYTSANGWRCGWETVSNYVW